MRLFKKRRTEQGRQTAKDASEGHRAYHFVDSGNPSLMEAFHQVLRETGQHRGRYSYRDIPTTEVEERLGALSPDTTEFGGVKQIGTSVEPVDDIGAIVSRLVARQRVYLVVADVDAEHRDWVEMVYRTMLDQAIGQGILPFPMYVTENPAAARLLMELLGVPERTLA